MPLCDASLECDELECASSTASPERRLRSLIDLSAMPAGGVAADAAKRFGEVLRDYRRAAGLTQEELAERAGVSPRSISGLERGEGATPRRDTVALLAKALELTGAQRAAFEGLL